MKRSVAAFAPLLLLVVIAAEARGDEWQPEKTHAVVAFVSRWADERIEPLAKNVGLERRFQNALVRDGVAPENLAVLKDEAVTRDALREALVSGLRATPRGGTFLFYFSGHGHRDGRGSIVFVTNDVDQDHVRQTGLRLEDVSSILEANGRGKKIILMGDMCFSGALDRVVKALDPHGIEAAALGSVVAENESTSRWTFTERLVEAFQGDATVAKDGQVTLASLEEQAKKAMLFEADQPIEFSRTRGFAPDFVIRAVDPRRKLRPIDGPYQLKDYLDARGRDGVWRRAQVQDEKAGRYLVRYVNESSGKKEGREEWLPVSRLRAPYVRDVETGAWVRVHDTEEHSWWDGIVTDVRHGFAFVEYDLLPRRFNEWVSTRNIRVPRSWDEPASTTTRTAASDAVVAREVEMARSAGRSLNRSVLAKDAPRRAETAGLLGGLDERLRAEEAPVER